MKKNLSYYKKFIKDSWIAFRPFSLTLAIGSTTLGIIAAYRMGLLFTNNIAFDVINIALITLAGLCAQAGSNLINDYFEGSFRYYRISSTKVKFLGVERSYFDIYVFLWGMCCFGLASLIGLYLILITDIQMLFIGLIGVVGAYAYTGEPFVYKRHGLGAILSFVLMGPLMVYGAYFVFGMEFSWYPIIISLPPSFLIPALMLSNEMRDFKRDSRLSVGTLSVRIGSSASKFIYTSLLSGAYLVTILLVILRIYPFQSLLVLATLPLAKKCYGSVSKFEHIGIPYTNNLHWLFTLIILSTLILF